MDIKEEKAKMENNDLTELEKKLKEIDENLFIDCNEDGTFIRYE